MGAGTSTGSGTNVIEVFESCAKTGATSAKTEASAIAPAATKIGAKRWLLLDRCIRVGAPLFPATHENLDARIAGEFQSNSLDRGSTAGLSVTNGRVIREDAALAEELAQLIGSLESAVLGEQLFPFEVGSTRNVATFLGLHLFSGKFSLASRVHDFDLVGFLDLFQRRDFFQTVSLKLGLERRAFDSWDGSFFGQIFLGPRGPSTIDDGDVFDAEILKGPPDARGVG